MDLDYICTGTEDIEPIRWNGHINLLRSTDPYELEVTARDSSFHILCGKHEYGSYICIPNWNIGTELAGLSDRFWNFECLTTYYPELSRWMQSALSTH
ncbi:hypothetical protein H0486_17005 [Lachnospiraceae bacterium MD1]|uniref:Uncharacterized protein n=1 Tax=Variimorphobacter saccharofermentans TaxID=2755051 RepID=A0A839K3P1_9FIRM|nr:DUF6618 family protein [Variimorphobacter saccharofermentans]MBB2183998.1 hypothetical protein [Variimorphobacter saccharofermentans]MBB2184580.1 hypothetical protein [Variimorphobacter saccharofermentans]